jgi:chromosome segregation protein
MPRWRGWRSELHHLRDLRQKVESRLAQLELEDGHWRGQAETLDRDDTRWKELLENAALRAQGAAARHAEAAAACPRRRPFAQKRAEEAAQALRRELAQAEQGLRVEEAHKSHADKTLEALNSVAAGWRPSAARSSSPMSAALAEPCRRGSELLPRSSLAGAAGRPNCSSACPSTRRSAARRPRAQSSAQKRLTERARAATPSSSCKAASSAKASWATG